jgi:hypothetical protein
MLPGKITDLSGKMADFSGEICRNMSYTQKELISKSQIKTKTENG